MTFNLFSRVALTKDLPATSLKKGDVVTIVEFHPGSTEKEPGYSAEVFNALGETFAVITVPESALEPLQSSEVLHVRQLQKVAEPSTEYNLPKK